MIIKKIPIRQINPAAYNPRKDLQPGDPEYARLAKSIREFDLVEPLIWNERSGNLVGGHQRLKIIKNELGLSEVEVSVVNLDEQREKALNVALNKIAGDWDIPRLKELLVSLDDGAFDLTLTGFDENELKKLIDFEGQEGKTDDDDIPPVPAAADVLTKPGDLWHLGNHRLLCGDATALPDLTFLLNGEKADLVFTDPPYNVDYEGYTDEKLKIKNDKMSDEQFKQFLLTVFASYRMVLKDGGAMYVCHPSSYQREFQDAMEMAGFKVRCQIIWAKNTFAWGHGRYKFQHEPIFYGYVDGQSDPWYGDKSQSTLWQEKKPAANRLHPTMKPVELILRAIRNSSKAGDLVVDLFGGSGSTLIAAEKANRRAFLTELDPAYCDVIVRRWEQFTGRKAVKAIDLGTVENNPSTQKVENALPEAVST